MTFFKKNRRGFLARWSSLGREGSLAAVVRELVLGVEGCKGFQGNGLGFCDGGNSFRIRCLFPEPGQWTWQTTCSDASNAGLHNRSGSVEVAPYSGSNPLYRHGDLRVGDNHRFLAHADGTPFLWIGDTPWAAPMNANLEDLRTYLRDRRDKQFTVLQVFCASGWAGSKDVFGNAPFLGAGLDQPNPAYWQEYEEKVQLANEQGLMVLVVGLMEPVKRYPDPASAQHFARHLVARLMGNFVIFSPSFDSTNPVIRRGTTNAPVRGFLFTYSQRAGTLAVSQWRESLS